MTPSHGETRAIDRLAQLYDLSQSNLTERDWQRLRDLAHRYPAYVPERL
jgi:hypothetical protein